MVEHSSANPKVPGLIPGSWIMIRHVHVQCHLLLEWSTTSQRLCMYKISVPYAQNIPDSYLKSEGGDPGNSGVLYQQ